MSDTHICMSTHPHTVKEHTHSRPELRENLTVLVDKMNTTNNSTNTINARPVIFYL